jgi:hypothetical protein
MVGDERPWMPRVFMVHPPGTSIGVTGGWAALIIWWRANSSLFPLHPIKEGVEDEAVMLTRVNFGNTLALLCPLSSLPSLGC